MVVDIHSLRACHCVSLHNKMHMNLADKFDYYDTILQVHYVGSNIHDLTFWKVSSQMFITFNRLCVCTLYQYQLKESNNIRRLFIYLSNLLWQLILYDMISYRSHVISSFCSLFIQGKIFIDKYNWHKIVGMSCSLHALCFIWLQHHLWTRSLNRAMFSVK